MDGPARDFHALFSRVLVEELAVAMLGNGFPGVTAPVVPVMESILENVQHNIAGRTIVGARTGERTTDRGRCVGVRELVQRDGDGDECVCLIMLFAICVRPVRQRPLDCPLECDGHRGTNTGTMTGTADEVEDSPLRQSAVHSYSFAGPRSTTHARMKF